MMQTGKVVVKTSVKKRPKISLVGFVERQYGVLFMRRRPPGPCSQKYVLFLQCYTIVGQNHKVDSGEIRVKSCKTAILLYYV